MQLDSIREYSDKQCDKSANRVLASAGLGNLLKRGFVSGKLQVKTEWTWQREPKYRKIITYHALPHLIGKICVWCAITNQKKHRDASMIKSRTSPHFTHSHAHKPPTRSLCRLAHTTRFYEVVNPKTHLLSWMPTKLENDKHVRDPVRQLFGFGWNLKNVNKKKTSAKY